MRERDEVRLPSRRELAVELAIMVAIGIALAALGPFGSFALGGFGARLAYWLPASFTGYVVFRPIAWAVTTAAERLGLPAYPALLLAILIGAFPASAAMLWIGGARAGDRVEMAALGQLYVQVALIGVLVGSFLTMVGRRAGASPEPTSTDTALAAPSAPFLDRLPPSWNGGLAALEMEDHYVRAHGPDGQSLLILMRMADATRELGGVDGAQVHRSWWVARDAVTGRSRDGRNLRLKLGHGLEAPVARDRQAELRDNGWFD
ncbi:MAG: LytTR family transcriptional regulator DNA-binding domain-containing protein [Sphingomicrobium sp.]